MTTSSTLSRRKLGSSAVRGLTAEQAAWKPSPERHSIWQIVRHVIRWKRGVLQAWAGDPPDYEQMTREDWQEATGDQAAWEADVRALNEIYSEFRQRLEALDDEGLGSPQRWYQQQKQPQPVALRLMRTFTHDIYHAGQIQYLRALQGIPLDRLATAAWDGDLARLREVLDVYSDVLNAHNRDGWTALQVASYSGQPEAVRFLLTRGANIHAPSQNEMATTALHCAVTGWQGAGERASPRSSSTAALTQRPPTLGGTRCCTWPRARGRARPYNSCCAEART